MQVVATNYNQYALVYFRKVYKSQEYFKITLYGRSPLWPLGPGSCSCLWGSKISPSHLLPAPQPLGNGREISPQIPPPPPPS